MWRVGLCRQRAPAGGRKGLGHEHGRTFQERSHVSSGGRTQNRRAKALFPAEPTAFEKFHVWPSLQRRVCYMPATAAPWGHTAESGHSVPREAHHPAARRTQTTTMRPCAKRYLPTAGRDGPGHTGRCRSPCRRRALGQMHRIADTWAPPGRRSPY